MTVTSSPHINQSLKDIEASFTRAVDRDPGTGILRDDDDVYYYICWRLKLEGETENMGVCTKERKGVTAAVLMATP